MHLPNSINEYVDLVCQQIRWKKAHFRVSEELKSHIVDARNALIEQGLDENTATEKAIAETGDATEIGAELDRIHRPKPQWGMFSAVGIMLIMGILIQLFINDNQSWADLLSSRIICTIIGVAFMLVAYFSDFSMLGKYPKTFFFSVIAFSIISLGFSPQRNGQYYYSQFFTLLFPIAFSVIVYATRNKGYLGLILCALAFMLEVYIAFCIPIFAGLIIVIVTSTVLLSVAISKNYFEIKRIHGLFLLIVPIAALAIFLCLYTNIWNRLAIAINPYLEPVGAGYRSIATREILSGAKLIGVGTVADTKDGLQILPQSELILTLVIANFGWVAFAIIMGILLFFIVKGFILCFKQKSRLGMLVSLSIMMTFSLQSLGYVLYNLGIQFCVPISLPLISSGNTAIIVNMVLIGFMLSVFRTGDIITDKIALSTSSQNEQFISWNDGKLTINFKMQ